MSNRYRDLVVVLPEDDANRQLANGFLNDPCLDHDRIQVLPVAGGWREAVALFLSEQAAPLRRYALRRTVLLIDFDGRPERLREVQRQVPRDLRDGVFILGAFTEPEDPKRKTGKRLESLGGEMARGCCEGGGEIWQHELLKHNGQELARLRKEVARFLFLN